MSSTETRRLTMPCDIETRRDTAERRAAWHADCPSPDTCACPAHDRDERPTPAGRTPS